jgi:hypothetical protein
MSSRLKSEVGGNYYNNVPFSKYSKPREDGDRSIRSAEDVFGVEALKNRDEADAPGTRFRRMMDIGLPGFKADNLSNLSAQEMYFDKLVELRVEAELIKDKVTPFTIMLGGIGAIAQSFRGVLDSAKNIAKDPLKPAREIASIPGRVIAGGMDIYSQANKESKLLHQAYHNKYAEYLQLCLAITLSERRDWQSYRLAEMDRAYFSQNRQEWFMMGNALSGLYQSVNFSVNEMDRSIKEAHAGVEGSNRRAALDIAFGFADWGASSFKIKS